MNKNYKNVVWNHKRTNYRWYVVWKNISNYNSELYRPEFWQNTNNIIYGSDAHDTNEMFLGETVKRKLDFY